MQNLNFDKPLQVQILNLLTVVRRQHRTTVRLSLNIFAPGTIGRI